MRSRSRRVLIAGLDSATCLRIAPLLGRDELEIEIVGKGAEAAELVAVRSFAAILLNYPLSDTDMLSLLETLRASDSPCRWSPVLILASAELRPEAESFIGQGANKVVTLPLTAAEEIPRVISSLLEVPPRLAVRMEAEFAIRLGPGGTTVSCETVNLSETGLLVRTTNPLALGTVVGFKVDAPARFGAIIGTAEVVRHTTPGRESVVGMGLRITGFEGEWEDRWLSFIHAITHLEILDTEARKHR